MNLKNVNHINKFRRLAYPKNEMLIVGSGTMALLGLKKNDDIDVWASKRVISLVSKNKSFIGKKSKLDGTILYETRDGSIEIGSTFPPFKSLRKQLQRAIVIYGIHFQNPRDVLRWKKYMNRPKDQRDIRALEKYLKSEVVENYLLALEGIG